jgi:hypothetical protein
LFWQVPDSVAISGESTMHNANIFLAEQHVLELRRQATEAREARVIRRPRRGRSLVARVRGER